MKKLISAITIAIFSLISGNAEAQLAEWVNNQGCYCGGYSSEIVHFISRGNGTLDERTASMDQMDYWNKYASIYNPMTLDTGFGAPRNGLNEVNTFITPSSAQSIYGYSMSPSLYGVAILQPSNAFGFFNECKYFSAVGCDYFNETDVLINSSFASGWTTDPDNYSNALVQTTALHEIGHAWGAHHVFSLPAFGDSYSTMNYINDDSGRFVTRMDANTIRAHYPGVAQTVLDVGIFPLVFGNSTYGETYTSVSPKSVAAGESLHISNFLIQNIGTQNALDTVTTFYLSIDTNIESTDYAIGTVEYSLLPVDSDIDLNVSLVIPDNIPAATYYIGAIVTVNGVEDSIGINNAFIIGRPSRTELTVTTQLPAPITQTITPPTDLTIAPGDVLGPITTSYTNNASSSYRYILYPYLIRPDSSKEWLPAERKRIREGTTKVYDRYFESRPSMPEGVYTYGISVTDDMNNEIDNDSFDFTVIAPSVE